jgi:precorrin-6B methylase 2
MYIDQFSLNQYKKFCGYEGSEHIVSEFALKNILLLIKKFDVEKTLEIGVGIGTISGSIIMFSEKQNLEIQVFGTEANEFCLGQIPLNLGEHVEKLNLYRDLSEISTSELFDLIIVDGSEKNLEKVQSLINPNGIILIEGDRTDQVETIKRIFKNLKYVQLISLNRNGEYSVKRSVDYQGGLKVIFIRTTRKQLLYWFSSKIKTKMKYFMRRH